SQRLQALRRQLPLGASVMPTTSLELFAISAPTAECAIVCGASPSARGFAEAVARMRAPSFGAPIVIVRSLSPGKTSRKALHTSRDAAAEGWARALPLAWRCRDDALMLAAIQGATTLALLRRFARDVREAKHLAPPLRDSLLIAIESTRPIASLGELAESVHTHRRTLWRRWRTMSVASVVRLEDVIDWILVLRAGVAHARGSTWSDVASALGVDRHTLAGAHRRLVGLSLVDATFDSQIVARARFREKVVSPLFAKQVKGKIAQARL
ncbi:MAG: hypothetical protein M3081_20080, partial [Gemmatimonadota bacterium]|nr:hypothetical protein [Gemmatimonadota bacterium]